MNGYLQRLVDTAAQPVATLHPFAGSIFAGRYEDDGRGSDSQESVILKSKTTSAIPSSMLESAADPEAARDAVRATKYRPILPRSLGTPVQPDRSPDQVPSRQEQSVPQTPLPATAAEAEAAIEQPRVRALHEVTFHPLIPPRIVVTEARVQPAPERANSSAPQGNRRAAAVEPESDDIQIHIGRVEVTAVHPPGRRAPQVPDRSLSLDAYLNRRTR